MTIADILKQLNPTARVASLFFEAEVLSVDKDTCTAVVKTVFGVELPGVKLTTVEGKPTNGFVCFPAVGSVVLVGADQSGKEFMAMGFSELNGVRINGDKYTLVKGDEAKAELQKIGAQVAAIKEALTQFIPVPGDGGAALKATAAALLASLPNADFSNIINEEVKHG